MKFFDEDDEQGLPDVAAGFEILLEGGVDLVLMEGAAADKALLEGAP